MNFKGPGDTAEVGRVVSQVRHLRGPQETQLTEPTSLLFAELFVRPLPVKSQTALSRDLSESLKLLHLPPVPPVPFLDCSRAHVCVRQTFGKVRVARPPEGITGAWPACPAHRILCSLRGIMRGKEGGAWGWTRWQLEGASSPVRNKS